MCVTCRFPTTLHRWTDSNTAVSMRRSLSPNGDWHVLPAAAPVPFHPTVSRFLSCQPFLCAGKKGVPAHEQKRKKRGAAYICSSSTWLSTVHITVIMREMAPIGEMAPGCGKRSKKEIIVFSHPHRRDGTGCDLNDVNPRVSATTPGPRGDIATPLAYHYYRYLCRFDAVHAWK